MKGFLIDECLTPWLVAIARGRGHAAEHVSTRFAGATDHVVAGYAIREDRAMVTANARDFLRLFAKNPDHRGLVLLIRPGDRPRQIEAFERALDEIERRNDVDGLVVEVSEDMSVDVRSWPPIPPSGDPA